MLTEDRNKDVFHYILDFEALVINYSFLPLSPLLCLLISISGIMRILSFLLLFQGTHQFTSISYH